jgi:hypothetical protein
MATYSGAGTCVSVSAATPATHDAAGFVALTYTQVGELESLAELTVNHTSVTFANLCTGRTSVNKGAEDPIEFDITCADDPADAGQTILRTARASLTATVAVRIVDQTGVTKYARGYVMSSREAGGAGINDTMLTTFRIGAIAPASGATVVRAGP